MVLKILILLFNKENISQLECCIHGKNMSFKLATSPSLMPLLFPSNFRFQEQLSTLVMDLDGIYVILKLETLDEPDDVNNDQKSIWVWLVP